jgi:hypothetical protein
MPGTPEWRNKLTTKTLTSWKYGFSVVVSAVDKAHGQVRMDVESQSSMHRCGEGRETSDYTKSK